MLFFIVLLFLSCRCLCICLKIVRLIFQPIAFKIITRISSVNKLVFDFNLEQQTWFPSLLRKVLYKGLQQQIPVASFIMGKNASVLTKLTVHQSCIHLYSNIQCPILLSEIISYHTRIYRVPLLLASIPDPYGTNGSLQEATLLHTFGCTRRSVNFIGISNELKRSKDGGC